MSQEQELLSETALLSFKLNGQFLDLAETLARPVGLTAAWWQVLGAVLHAPLSVAGIAREMGMARQSVQRIADLLVDREMAVYRDNPAHRRAKLLSPTEAGLAAVRKINPGHARAAETLAKAFGLSRLHDAVTALRTLSSALDEIAQPDQQRAAAWATNSSIAGSGSTEVQETMLTRSQ